MSCRYCTDASLKIREKLGRCKRCMMQLLVLNLVIWPVWWLGFRDTPKSVESIALIITGGCAAGLLALHLLLMPFRR